MSIYDRILELLETGDDECTILGAILWKNHSTLTELKADNGNHYVWSSDTCLAKNSLYIYINGVIPYNSYQTYNWGGIWIEDPSRTITLVYNPYLDAPPQYNNQITGHGYGGINYIGSSAVAQFSGTSTQTIQCTGYNV